MPGLKWERVSTIRTVLLIVVGLGALVVSAWGFDWRAGTATLGVSCLLLEFLTGERPEQMGARS
jgi:hypothetical protein